ARFLLTQSAMDRDFQDVVLWLASLWALVLVPPFAVLCILTSAIALLRPPSAAPRAPLAFALPAAAACVALAWWFRGSIELSILFVAVGSLTALSALAATARDQNG